jgi:hypothetical protein
MARKSEKWAISADIKAKLVGRTIKDVILDDERDGRDAQVLLLLDNSSIVFAWRDEEGNGPGVLLHGDATGMTYVQQRIVQTKEEAHANAG